MDRATGLHRGWGSLASCTPSPTPCAGQGAEEMFPGVGCLSPSPQPGPGGPGSRAPAHTCTLANACKLLHIPVHSCTCLHTLARACTHLPTYPWSPGKTGNPHAESPGPRQATPWASAPWSLAQGSRGCFWQQGQAQDPVPPKASAPSPPASLARGLCRSRSVPCRRVRHGQQMAGAGGAVPASLPA